MDLIFEKSRPGRQGCAIPAGDVPAVNPREVIPPSLLRDEVPLPEVAEVDLIRHYTALSRRNFGVDVGFYPLGSCTMKYNPKINEDVAKFPGFTGLHPYAPVVFSQGSLQLMYELRQYLSEIFGMADFTLQPAAGAHGELTGIMIFKKYFEKTGEKRTKILIPDAAHGTNPASGALCGYRTLTVRSNADGGVDIDHLASLMSDDTAGLMLTNPNTLGLFERNIEKVSDIIHNKGGLLYGDGANANAFLGKARPGDLGFDVIQLNLHKTFSTPHGCGGPGSGPVGVGKKLVDFLPIPRVIKTDEGFAWSSEYPDAIGRVRTFFGNFNVMVKAYAYIRTLGPAGLKRAAEIAVLNANYIKARLQPYYDLSFDRPCMHECVVQGIIEGAPGVRALDISKRLIDYGVHPPTNYFPLIVPEALMIEPTETESKANVERYAEIMVRIAGEARADPEALHQAPTRAPVRRLDEVRAARNPVLRWGG